MSEANNKRKAKIAKSAVIQLASELGKLPPQAVDVEEVILGAIMIDEKAFGIVSPILRPEHFYKEAHQLIYSACEQLHANRSPIDILLVANELKSKSKLDLVGGPYYISQLTNRVASGSNIEYHSRIVLQKALQRDLIKLSSEVARDAYEETTNVLEVLDNLYKQSRSLKVNSLETAEEFTDQSKEIEEALCITFLDRVFLTTGNVSGIVAPPGSGKSGVCDIISAAAIAKKHGLEIDGLGFDINLYGRKLLHIDTERSRNDFIKGWRRIRRRTHSEQNPAMMQGDRFADLDYVSFKKIARKDDRRRKLEDLLSSRKYGIVLIDGIADFVAGVNDEEGAVEFLGWLTAMAEEYVMGIFITIHDNPAIGKTKPRGHLGSEFYRKAEGMLLLTKVKDGQVPEQRMLTTNFEYGKMRNASNDNEHHFSWSDELGMFASLEVQPPKAPSLNEAAERMGKKRTAQTVQDMVAKFEKLFDREPAMTPGRLKSALSEAYQVSLSMTKRWVSEMAEVGYLEKRADGKYRMIKPKQEDLPF